MTIRALEGAQSWIFDQLLQLPGVSESQSRFGNREALTFGGQELLHFDEPGLADIRLGRSLIRARRDELSLDPAVTIRAGDWVHVRFTGLTDAVTVVRWARMRVDEVR